MLNITPNPEITTKDFGIDNKKPNINPSHISDVGAEYSLCHSFMRITGDQLVQKQLQIMLQSQNLLDSLSRKISTPNFDMDCSIHDLQRTIETSSKYFDASILNLNDDNVSMQSRNRRIISRKNQTTELKRSMVQQPLNQALDQIRESCSRTTFNKISDILKDFKNLQIRLAEFQNKQRPGLFKRAQNKPTTDHFEQNIFLTTKNTKLSKENCQLKEKIKDLQLKLKNKSSTQSNGSLTKINNLLSRRSSFETRTIEQTKNLTKEKGELTTLRQKQLEQIHQKIFGLLDEKFSTSCEKCCPMMKKIKESLVKYRNCLQQQIMQNQQLHKKYQEKLQKIGLEQQKYIEKINKKYAENQIQKRV